MVYIEFSGSMAKSRAAQQSDINDHKRIYKILYNKGNTYLNVHVKKIKDFINDRLIKLGLKG